MPSKKISTEIYEITDYDFDDKVWSLWKKLSINNPQVWLDVIIEMIMNTGYTPVDIIKTKVLQRGI